MANRCEFWHDRVTNQMEGWTEFKVIKLRMGEKNEELNGEKSRIVCGWTVKVWAVEVVQGLE